MSERQLRPLPSRRVFFGILIRSGGLGAIILGCSLGIGIVGYHVFERLPWLDSFTSAAMILSGMGPVEPLRTAAGKVFAGCYALFSGLAFITSMGIFFAPVVRRFLHKFHLQSLWEKTDSKDSK